MLLSPSDLLNDSLNDVLHQDRLLQLSHVLFKGNRIYRHRLLRINYTTYDLQRDFDSINPRTNHRDIMLLSDSDDNAHPFSYARVLGIFHANIIYTGPGSRDFQSRRIEFCGSDGLKYCRIISWHGNNMLSTWSDSYPWQTRMHLASSTLPMCSGAAILFLLLQMADCTLTVMQGLVAQVIRMIGSDIMSTGEFNQMM